jgi:glycosyltransferase involved in cell wall biosynthesis
VIAITCVPPLQSLPKYLRANFHFTLRCEILHSLKDASLRRSLRPMIQFAQDPTATPLFSIVIPVYNDWVSLDQCLKSLAAQTAPPSFEVIVVDDGSKETAPQSFSSLYYGYSLTVIRQPHAGIPTARNRGIRLSKGTILLFVDADCRLDPNCLANLNSTISRSPLHDCFQLRLVGNSSSLVGRAEDLRLTTFQTLMLQPDDRIRYLNTAGFAIRHARLGIGTDVFDPAALRAEDTLLLANLMQAGELPLFVPDAVVEHAIPLSLMACFRKDVRSVYLERRAYDIIASKGVRIRVTQRERLELLWFMWKAAGQDSVGRSAWLVVVVRQVFQRMISFGYQCLRPRLAANV